MGACVSKKQVELKVLSSAQFAKAIQELVDESNGQINHLEAVQEFLEQNEEVEPETLASLIQRNQKLKALLYEDAEQLNLVVKESRLPVDE
jgi:ferritin-like metal-binding protein YciE